MDEEYVRTIGGVKVSLHILVASAIPSIKLSNLNFID